jgi:hypothetical protein
MDRIALPAAAFTTLVLLAFAPTASAAVCTTAAGCEFWDNDHHEYILYEVDTSSIDVLILPPATPFAALGDMDILRSSVQAWDDGIDALGPAWLASGVDIRTYVIGEDVPPASALQDPEIIVATAEYNPVVLFGIGLQVPIGVCTQQGGVASTLFQHAHADGASSVQAVQCQSGGIQCVVLNTNFLLGGERRLYDLNAHEVGHCLGIGHVGDALDFDAKTVPLTDIMSYNDVPSQVHCVSTLNIRAFEAVYAPLLGQAGGQGPGTYVHQAPSAYGQVACANP